MDRIRVVVIGHKDHGKSTLIGRLLYDRGAVKPDRMDEVARCSRDTGSPSFNFAFLLDTFEEEREKGLTIDTVQVGLKSKKYEYIFIDCPGHRELITNMLTGASDASAALLVVSANPREGIQPQTVEHVKLVRMLGISQLAVAVTKMDTVNFGRKRYAVLARKIRNLLAKHRYDVLRIPLVPVAGPRGTNLWRKGRETEWYKGKSLVGALDTVLRPSPPAFERPLRMPVQDAFFVRGTNYVTGKVETGSLRTGDSVIFQPSGISGAVSSIRMLNRERTTVRAGDNVELTLRAENVSLIRRGEVGGHNASPPAVADTLDVELIMFRDVLVRGDGNLTFHYGSCSVEGKIKQAKGRYPFFKATICLSKKIAVEEYANFPPLGRFMVSSGKDIAGAGTVTVIHE